MRFLSIYLCLTLLSGCYQAESSLTDSLIYCTDEAPSSFNPQISHDVASLDATTHQLYNRLVKIDPISQHFIADVATHWSVSADKMAYTFYLRQDINFHHNDYFTPSRKLNADDVIYSFQRLLSKKHPFHNVNISKQAQTYLYPQPFSNLVRQIIKIDDHTIRFVLNKPSVTLLANLAAHYAVIHSKEYALTLLKSGQAEKIDSHPIGTGPYQFKQNSNRQLIRYQAHKYPWQTPVNINNLIFDITPNSTKRYAKLLSGECDIITNPASSQVHQISKNHHITLSIQPTTNVALIAFNTQKPYLNNAVIRNALTQAIDMKNILDAVFFDTATVTHSLLAESSWAYNPRIPKADFNPQQSRFLLKQSNFDFSKTLRILTPIKNSIFNPHFYKTAELIQSNLADIGVISKIIQLRHVELQLALTEGEYDLYLTGISPYTNDPDNLFRPLLNCNANALAGNSSQWCDNKMQRLLDDTLLEVNFIQRVKNYYQLQEDIQAQKIYIPIAHLLRFDVSNKNISKLQINPLTGINFHHVKKVAPLIKEADL
ncbi:MAG: ABC transporter substrate-binding protein [Psychromonas sp.]